LTRFVVAAALSLLVIGDAAEALAQTLWSDKGARPVLYAEAGRRRTKRRPPASTAAQDQSADSSGEGEAAEGAEQGGEGVGAGEAAEGGAGEAAEGGEGQDSGGAPSGEISGEGGSLRRSGRMDFDERLVKGQGARSGAVYLFKRTPRKLPELVALRTTYRERILQPVLRERALPAPAPEQAPTKVEATPEPTKAAPAVDENPPEKAPETKAAQRRRRKRGRLLRRRPQAQKTEQ
jgi:hypothetical protein